MVTNQTYYTIGQRVEVLPPAEETGTGTVINTYLDHGMDIRLELYLVKLDTGVEYWTNDAEMKGTE